MRSGRVHVGDVVADRYVLEQFLGAGGMASVYRATDTHLDRAVAVKVFSADAGDLENEARRTSEAKLLASVNHPALVTLYDAHLGPGSPYLVMEYIDGGTLHDLLDRGCVPAVVLAGIGADLALGLDAIHSAGIVHRDVKPANVLLRTDAATDGSLRATLADFGVAYLIDAARLTSPGIAIGTAAYMAPEQVRGATPTPPSDVYSLGLVLLECLTGHRPFADLTPIEALAARATTPPIVPATLGPGWRSLLTAMTAIDPLARPSARALVDRFTDVAAADAIDAAAMTTRPLTTWRGVLHPQPVPAADPTALDMDLRDVRVGRGLARHRLAQRRRPLMLAGPAGAVLAATVMATLTWGGFQVNEPPAPSRPYVVAPPRVGSPEPTAPPSSDGSELVSNPSFEPRVALPVGDAPSSDTNSEVVPTGDSAVSENGEVGNGNGTSEVGTGNGKGNENGPGSDSGNHGAGNNSNGGSNGNGNANANGGNNGNGRGNAD